MQPIRLTGARECVLRRDFIYCSGLEGTPFGSLRAKLDADPAWRVHDIPTAHNAMREAPDAVADILLDD